MKETKEKLEKISASKKCKKCGEENCETIFEYTTENFIVRDCEPDGLNNLPEYLLGDNND